MVRDKISNEKTFTYLDIIIVFDYDIIKLVILRLSKQSGTFYNVRYLRLDQKLTKLSF